MLNSSQYFNNRPIKPNSTVANYALLIQLVNGFVDTMLAHINQQSSVSFWPANDYGRNALYGLSELVKKFIESNDHCPITPTHVITALKNIFEQTVYSNNFKSELAKVLLSGEIKYRLFTTVEERMKFGKTTHKLETYLCYCTTLSSSIFSEQALFQMANSLVMAVPSVPPNCNINQMRSEDYASLTKLDEIKTQDNIFDLATVASALFKQELRFLQSNNIELNHTSSAKCSANK